jgi:hypothetical protein
MKKLSGVIFDTYDDFDGRVLKSIITSTNDLPDYIKTASRLSSDQIERLPDDQFALIVIDRGQKFKKYATVDKGNTLLSVAYLLKQAESLEKLSPLSLKVASRNLIAACELHGIPVFPALRKLAAWPAEKIQLGKHEAATADVEERTNLQGTPGANFMELPTFEQKEKIKTAAPEGVTVITKQKSWRESPYMDASTFDFSALDSREEAPAQRTLLDGQFPIDGYDQVKTASAYYEENWKEFHPRKRHDYCVKLASRMSELGMEVPEEVQRYGSDTYASDVDAYVSFRRSHVPEEFHPAVDLLLEKRAQVSPGAFAEALAEFDDITGLRWHWDGHIKDPWYSTFGPSLEKLAEDDWRYDEAGCRIGEAELNDLAINGMPLLHKAFGSSFASEFRKNPKSVFESLPKPNKLVLARLAMDRTSGTGTE